MLPRNVRFTYRDYVNMPESETKRYELLDGEIFVVPSPNTNHQRIVGNLFLAFRDYARTAGSGEVFLSPLDVVLSDHDVLQPDVTYVSLQRSHFVTRGHQRRPGPGGGSAVAWHEDRDLTAKRAIYARWGVREYWIVDPEARTVEVMKAGEPDFETVRVYSEGAAARHRSWRGWRSTWPPSLRVNA